MFIAWFSLLGITLGVATLIIVMSVMNSFRAELIDGILGLNGHLGVYSQNGLMTDYNRTALNISPNCPALLCHPQVEGAGYGLQPEAVLWCCGARGKLVRPCRPKITLEQSGRSSFRSIQRR